MITFNSHLKIYIFPHPISISIIKITSHENSSFCQSCQVCGRWFFDKISTHINSVSMDTVVNAIYTRKCSCKHMQAPHAWHSWQFIARYQERLRRCTLVLRRLRCMAQFAYCMLLMRWCVDQKCVTNAIGDIRKIFLYSSCII